MKQKNKQKKSLLIMQVFPIIGAIGLVPLIMHIHSYQTGLTVYDWFPNNSDSQVEFFLFWKSVAIILLGIIMLCILLYQKAKHYSFQFENCFYLLAFYTMFVCMSALFSTYKKWVCFGLFEILEPIWVLLAYIILCYYAYHVTREENQLKTIIQFSSIFVGLALCIGISQLLGHNLLDTKIAKMLILNPQNWSNSDQLHFGFSNIVYITLYNPDFVIFYIGIILPITIYTMFAARGIVKKVIATIFCVASVVCLVGSKTTTGMISVCVTVIIVGLILLSRRKKYFIIGVITVLLTLLIGVIVVMNNPVFQNIKKAFFGTYKADVAYGIKSIQTDKDITVNYNGIKTHFEYNADPELSLVTVSVFDDNEKLVMQSDASNGKTWYKDANNVLYDIEAIKAEDRLGIELTIDNLTWDFFKLDDDKYYYLNAAGKFVDFPNSKQVQWFNEDALSDRGHIYNKTIPVLGKHFLIGSGANTYMLEVPQDDYIYKNSMGINNTFDVKPHSWYLQQWVENGMIAMLLLLGFYLWYFINAVRILRRVDFHENLHKLCLAIFTGLLIYMVAAIANDATVNVAPLYWATLGIGIAVNRMIFEKEKLSCLSHDEIIAEGQENSSENEKTKDKTSSKKKQSRKKRKAAK